MANPYFFSKKNNATLVYRNLVYTLVPSTTPTQQANFRFDPVKGERATRIELLTPLQCLIFTIAPCFFVGIIK